MLCCKTKKSPFVIAILDIWVGNLNLGIEEFYMLKSGCSFSSLQIQGW